MARLEWVGEDITFRYTLVSRAAREGADLSPSGPSPEEFTRAIEDGLEYLRTIHEAD